MEITASLVKELREKTGAGMMDCKKALQENNGEIEKAVEYLRKKGIATAQKRADRATNEGIIEAYIHPGSKLGVLVEINCETDFVAKTDDFKSFARDIAMHIAASNPLAVDKEDLDKDFIEKEMDIFKSQAENLNKPANIVEKIAQGKLDKRLSEVCLLTQPFVKIPDKTVKDHLMDLVAKLGENVTIRKFIRFRIGE